MYKQYDMYVVNGKCTTSKKNVEYCKKCEMVECKSIDLDIKKGDKDVHLDITLKTNKNGLERL